MGNSIKFKDSELVAKRWAKALMELALENDGISKEDILDDLKEINFIISESKDLSEVFANPSISQEEKQVVLEKIFKTATPYYAILVDEDGNTLGGKEVNFNILNKNWIQYIHTGSNKIVK